MYSYIDKRTNKLIYIKPYVMKNENTKIRLN